MDMDSGKSITKECSIQYVILTFIILCLFTGLLFTAFLSVSDPTNNYSEISDIRFASGTSSKTGSLSQNDWHSSIDGIDIHKDESDTYIYLAGRFPDEKIQSLRLIGENATFSLKIDNQIVFNTLNGGLNLSPSSYSDVILTEDCSGKEFDVIAYVPFADSIGIYYSLDKPTANPANTIAAFVIGFIAVLVFILIHLKTKTLKKLSVKDLAPVALLLSGAVMLFRDFHGSTTLLRMQVAFNGVICLIVFVCILIKKYSWTENSEILFSMNILYIAIVLFMPYKMFVVTALRLGILLQTINGVFLFSKWVKLRNRRIDKALPYVLGFFVPNIYFWYRLAAGNISNSFVLFACVSLVTIVCYTVSELIPAKKAEPIKKAKAVSKTKEQSMAKTEEKSEKPAPKIPQEAIPDIYTDNTFSDLSVKYTQISSSENVKSSILSLVNSKGIGENGHALRVAEYTRILCYAMGMSVIKAEGISDATLLHDIGKIVVSNEILDKLKPTKEEISQIRRHSEYGYSMLSGSSDEFSTLAANIAREHHEHVDGSGYIGLKGYEICLPARIVAVADVFDALTSYRAYKKTWSFEEARNYLIDNSGTYFDEDIVNCFLRAEQEIRSVYDIFRNSNANAPGGREN